MTPTTIQAGQSASLTWQTSNATDVSIDGIGAVQPNGSQSVSPTDSTTYHLVAKGAGGTQEATARLTVTQAPPPPPPTPTVTDEDLFSQNVKDVYFDYDKADVRGDQQSSVQADAQFFSQHPNMNFTIEGHCDERGSTEYNLALGDQRASAVKSALTAAGVNASRIKTISYGKEKPFCTESNEACWQQNRRGHLVLRSSDNAGDASCVPRTLSSRVYDDHVCPEMVAVIPLNLPVPRGPFCCGIIPACGTIKASKIVQEIHYENTSCFRLLALLSVLWLGVAPAWGVSKEMVQLQTQVQQLQEQMTAMQRSFDERMGVMKNLVEKDTDAVNKVANALNALQTTLQKQQATAGSKIGPALRPDSGAERHHGRAQGAPGEGHEATRRHAGGAAESRGAADATTGAAGRDQASAPPPDVLYNNALRDYNGGKNDLATQEFSDYIKFYPNTDLAGNCYFYLGEIQFRGGKLSAGGAKLRSGPAEFSQREQGGIGAVKKGIRADRTRQAG